MSSLSIIVPCYNEEGNVRATVQDIVDSIEGAVADYEILIFNDASQDRTGEIIDELAKGNPRIQGYHHRENLGLGATYYRGVELATKEYVMSVFGDNEVTKESLHFLFQQVGKADILIPYLTNHDIRPWHRQLLSWGFGTIINALTRRRIRYYNGPAIHRRENLLNLPTRNAGFAYMAEILTVMLNGGTSYLEVPYQMRTRSYGSSSALRFRNCLSVSATIASIFKRQWLTR